MPISASDLLLFSSANIPTADTGTSGGARSTTSRPDVTQLTANAVIAVISDGADTRTITITGRNAAGVVVTEVLTLNGATEVLGTTTFERIQSAVASATSATRQVLVKQGTGGATRATIRINETTAHIHFQNSASGAAITTRYEKGFWRNNHATLTLTAAVVKLTADPSAKIKIGLATAKGDTVSVAARTTAPASITFVDDNVAAAVPGNTLEAVTDIGMWVEQTLAANDVAYRSTFTTELSGQTT